MRSRAGSSRRSPAADTPPPTTTTSGSNTATRPAIPMPTHSPISPSTVQARSSPAAAAAVIAAPCGTSNPASSAARTRARPLPYCSQQPRLPHGQGRPSRSTIRWPISPDAPCQPRRSTPSMMIAPPIPVPTATNTASCAPRAAPKRDSAQPPALASLSSTTGSPSAVASSPRSGSSWNGRCAANRTVSPARSTSPATPTPTASTECSAARSRATPMIASTSDWRSLTGVAMSRRATTRPLESTTPAAIFVPPTSMPTARAELTSLGSLLWAHFSGGIVLSRKSRITRPTWIAASVTVSVTWSTISGWSWR